ncbi:PAS domain S-box protein [Methylobacillus gramineus]|uniref:PAS domain S-box protein n=1 Tax=Methylobacillus gramineus TaxID=755169 RepID=UPI001CFFDADE|nr:PAS domain S-box protein [Methylobacillus gramineus]MCB5185889.1 PAS domain S-box protein [Methylobacillus gramineus]
MPAALLPPNENERIAMLHALALLDTPAEEVFDRITRVVAHTLHVPIALVSFIDSDRQWFKSKVGIDVSETSREVAFCAHAVYETSSLVVPDATLDARFSDNPFVTDAPNIRFYAGIPITTSGGLALGTLCAVDDKPRQLSDEQFQVLSDLAFLVSKEIQLRESLAVTRLDLKASEQGLEASQARFRTIFERAAVGIALIAPNGGWLSVNDELCRIVGYSQDELLQLTFQDITYSEDLNTDLSLLHQLSEGEIDRYQLEKRYIRKDGKLVWINLSVTKQLSNKGELEYFVSIVKDIQAVKEAEHSLMELRLDLENRVAVRTLELRESNEMLSHAMSLQKQSEDELRKRELELRMVIENANDAYICIDQEGIVSAWNHQAEETFGWSAMEAIGKKMDYLIIPQHLHHAHHQGMDRYLRTGEAAVLGKRVELSAACKDGRIIPVEVRITALEIDGQTIFSAFLHDISERKAIEATREHEARHDALTGLTNRRGFAEILPHAMARSDRNMHAMALLFIDLDGFKQVNDTFGHDAGDLLLKEVAQRFNTTVRQTDAVSRLAGDEFTILLEPISGDQSSVTAVAHKILDALSTPVLLGRNAIHIGASIGITMYQPRSSKTADEMVKAADNAMYEAKRRGKNQFQVSV